MMTVSLSCALLGVPSGSNLPCKGLLYYAIIHNVTCCDSCFPLIASNPLVRSSTDMNTPPTYMGTTTTKPHYTVVFLTNLCTTIFDAKSQ